MPRRETSRAWQAIGQPSGTSFAQLCSAAVLSAAVVLTAQSARADEGGVSFWLPGLFGSLAATPLQPGWTVSSTYWHDSVTGGGDIALSREFETRRIPVNLTAAISGDVSATYDLAMVNAIYTFATPVLGGQANIGMMGIYGRNSTTLNAAIAGKLGRPEEHEKQTRRMLADRRSLNLATNFAGQWLRLRNLEAVSPNARLFPDFDDNLRQAFRQETELFFDSVVREDRSVLDLIRADYTFLNERLAKHYGIPDVYGSRFRRVTLAPDSHRGGLLRQGSILSVTSYATRTSPIIRGVWFLDGIFGAPSPPPLPNVPSLDEGTVSASLPMRQRLAAHRSNAVCANCHRTIDPVGFALESFNAIGQWRDHDVDDKAIDVSGALPGVGELRGVVGLEDGLLSRPELFAGTLTEKLLTFALGRGIEYYDAPAVRKIVHDGGKDGYRFSSLILGIVKSTPFQLRTAS